MTEMLKLSDIYTIGKFMYRFRIHKSLGSGNFSALMFYMHANGLNSCYGIKSDFMHAKCDP